MLVSSSNSQNGTMTTSGLSGAEMWYNVGNKYDETFI